MEWVDLIVIGAGWNGLAVAKTYKEVYPTAKILVLDDADTIGGTWAQHRLYPGLKTNNMVGTYEFSDFPMDEATFGVKPGEFIPGPVVHEYLRKYAEKFDVYRLIRFGVTVQTVEKVTEVGGGSEAGWILTADSKSAAFTTTRQLLTKKLVISTGLTSSPDIPSIPGSDCFATPLFHSRDLLAPALKRATRITVLGGCKSAWDTVYEYAARGIRVDMVIRSSGRGPTWMAPPYVTPLKRWLEKLVHTRFLTWFSPCVWGEATGFGGLMRRALHGTALGTRVVRSFFAVLGNDLETLNGYDKHKETAKLKPWTDPMWFGASGLSILNYPTDFFELVRNGIVAVHIADITRLSPNTVHLDTGIELHTDALVCATGWKCKSQSVKFLPESLDQSLGLPSAVDQDGPIILALKVKVEAEIKNHFRILMNPAPPKPGSEPLMRPYRLYRFMVPPALIEDRSIAFAGCIMTISTSLVAQAQALWIAAYFSSSPDCQPNDRSRRSGDGNPVFPIPSVEQAKYESVLHTEFCKMRYPASSGNKFPDFAFDTLAYLDLLLKDLGLKGKRKTWWRDWWDAYSPKDYQGLVGEWLAKRG